MTLRRSYEPSRRLQATNVMKGREQIISWRSSFYRK